MDWKLVIQVVVTLIGSVGGAGAIIIGMSNWLAGLFANRLLEKYKAEQAAELEELKNRYNREIEEYRTKATLLISQVERFSNQQFTQYNQLWVALIGLKIAGDTLWEDASSENLIMYAQQFRSTHKAVQEGAIFLEERHYQRLTSILNIFRQYEFGKKKLVEIRRHDLININRDESQQINLNATHKKTYSDLLDEIRSDFIRQLRNPAIVEEN